MHLYPADQEAAGEKRTLQNRQVLGEDLVLFLDERLQLARVAVNVAAADQLEDPKPDDKNIRHDGPATICLANPVQATAA